MILGSLMGVRLSELGSARVVSCTITFLSCINLPVVSGRKNVLRKLLRILYRRLKAGFPVCWLCSTVCLFVTGWCERLLLEKPFYFFVVFVFRHLKITLDSEQPMLKEKRIIPSVWGGIKSFEHFQRGEYFFDWSFDLFVSWFRLISPGWIKTHFFLN